MKTKTQSSFAGFLIKLSVTLGLVVAVFLLWGICSKAEAATSEFKLNSSDTRDQYMPAVGVDSSNRFYIAWSDNRSFASRFDIYGRIYNSSGNSITNDATALDDNDQTSCYSPSLVVNSSNNNVLLTWQDEQRSAPVGGDSVFGKLFEYSTGLINDFGTAQSGPGGNTSDFKMNDDVTNFKCDTPWVTTDGTNFSIGYYNKNLGAVEGGDDGTRVKLAFVNSAAFPKDKKTAIAGNYQSSYDAEETAVINNPTSKLTWKKAVAWIGSNDHVYIQRYRSNGTKHSGIEDIDESEGDSTQVSRINLAVNNQGHLAVAWSRGTSLPGVDAHYAIYNGSWGSAQTIEPDPYGVISSPRVIAKGKIFYAVYPQASKGPHPKYGDLRIRRITKIASGYDEDKEDGLDADWVTEWTSPSEVQFSLLVLPKTDNETFRLGVQYSAKKDTGNYKQIWGLQAKVKFYEEVEDQIWVSESEVKALTGTGTAGYLSPKATQISPGKYCLVYTKNYQGAYPSNPLSYVKTFSDATFESGGGIASYPLGDPITFNGGKVEIASDNNGAVGVVYQNSSKIYVRRYDANLKALGSALRVDEEATEASRYPSVCALSDGDFLVGFSGKYQGSSKYQAQQVPIKAFSSSLTSSTFNPSGAQAEQQPLGFLGGLIKKAQAAEGMEQLPAGAVEWKEITWAKSGTGSQSTIIVQVSTDEGEHWLTVSNGDQVSDKIRSSGVDMPSLSETIKYRIIANSTGGGGKPQLDWIQIGYGPGVTDYDYFMKVTPASAKVVVDTTKTVTVKVTRKEAEEGGAGSGPITLAPKATAVAVEGQQTESEGEPVADQEITAKFTSGGHGKLKTITGEKLEIPGGGTEEGTVPEGEEGSVRGEAIEQEGSGGGALPGESAGGSISGRTDENGEFKFYYEAPSEYNLEDIIQVSATPAGESEIKVDITMVTVYPVNTVFTSDPAFVGHNKPVTFTGAITNHISVPVNNITADMRLNQSLAYIPNSATINGREENVRVVMQDGALRFECIGTEGGAEKGALEGGGSPRGEAGEVEEGEGSSVRGKQITLDIEGEGVGQEGGGVLQPGETIYLVFKATAKVVEGEGEARGLGESSSSNLYEAGLTLSYKEQESGRQYQNGEVTAQGTVASIWLQTLFGDIYAQGGFLAEVMPPSGNQNATYLVQTDSTISHFTSKAGSRYEIQNYIQGILSPVNVKRLMRDQVDQVLADKERFKVREITSGLHQVSDLDKDRREVVYVKGDLVLETDADFRSPLTVVVTGDLRIKDSTDYDNTPVDSIKKLPSLGFIVLGDTTIESNVTHGVGAIYSEGTISTGDSNKQLVWKGLWVASGFNLDRTHFHTGDVLEPAEKVIYDGRVVANPPTGFAELTDFPVWKEVPASR